MMDLYSRPQSKVQVIGKSRLQAQKQLDIHSSMDL